jgi:hypothetical protein
MFVKNKNGCGVAAAQPYLWIVNCTEFEDSAFLCKVLVMERLSIVGLIPELRRSVV